MKLLVLGGTRFVGRHAVQEAIGRGHDVTLFNRGVTAPDLFSGKATQVLGDRDQSLQSLESGTWDAVLDFCGYRPAQLRASCQFLKSRVGRYAFISTLSVYKATDQAVTEETPVLQMPAGRHESEELDNDIYGPLKALAEGEVRNAFSSSSLVLRIGLQVGPYDQADRFGSWLERIATRNAVLTPDDAGSWQLIDARDTARFLIDAIENGLGGTFNVTGEVTSRSEVLELARQSLNPNCSLIPVESQQLVSAGMEERDVMALSLRSRNRDGHLVASISKAKAAGLNPRPMSETISDTWEWLKTLPADREREAGIPPSIENQILSSIGR